MNENIKPIEDTKNLITQTEPAIIHEIKQENFTEPKPEEKNINNLPDWDIEPPLQIKRGE